MDFSIENRVERGIARLDHSGPDDWRDRINTDDGFDVARIDVCPLAQIFGDFGVGYRALGLDDENIWKFGFDINSDGPFFDDVEEFEALTAEWRRRLS